MSEIFISWSKAKSGEFAKITKQLLETLLSPESVFMSSEDIHAGEHVQNKIVEQIEQCKILILCFTSENKNSPWLLYEAGYASGLHKHVIPFLFDNDPMWNSWIDNPMNIAREINFNRGDLEKTLCEAFSFPKNLYTTRCIKAFKKDVNRIREDFRLVDKECEDFVEKLTEIDKFNITSPYYHDRTAYFLSGFETFELWKVITQSFLNTGKYLWIYGRKNMKLFGGNFNELFEYLDQKTTQPMMDGIDFKILFLNPDSEQVHYAHKDQDIFEPELKATISRAKKVIGSNAVLQKCCRMYSNRREEIIIRIDNCILYCKPHFDINGNPNIMTNSKFEVFSALSDRGKSCIEKYTEIWNNSTDMFPST